MEQRNYQYLADMLTKLVSTTTLSEELRRNMQAAEKLDKRDFTITIAKTFGDDKVAYKFNFGKGQADKGDYFFLNNYQATLQRNNKNEITQTFSMFKQKGFNIDEAYNLMNRASVRRTVKSSNSDIPMARWYRLDFNQPKEMGGYTMVSVSETDLKFNLARELSKINLSEASALQKEAIIKRIESGGRPAVTTKDNQTLYISARPHEGTLVLLDRENQEVRRTNSIGFEVIQESEKTAKKNKKGVSQKQGKQSAAKKKEGAVPVTGSLENGTAGRDAGQETRVSDTTVKLMEKDINGQPAQSQGMRI